MAPRSHPIAPPARRALPGAAGSAVGATALAVTAALLLGGCVQHQARVGSPVPPPAAPAGEAGDQPTATTVITLSTLAVDPPPATTTSMLPIDLPVSAWRREADGRLARGEIRVQTPLPWWQRFPADAVSDLLPWTYTAAADGEVHLEIVAPLAEGELLEAARRDGYARGPAPALPEKPSP